MSTLASMFKNMVGVSIDYEEAFKHIKIVGDNWNVEPMILAVYILSNLECTPASCEKAIIFFKIVINKCDTYTMYHYANMLENGEGMLNNTDEAPKYYKITVGNDYFSTYADKHVKEINIKGSEKTVYLGKNCLPSYRNML